MIDESPDELESLLAPQSASVPAQLQESIRLRTEGVLKRRRIVKRLGKVGIIAAIFWAGTGPDGTRPLPSPSRRPSFTLSNTFPWLGPRLKFRPLRSRLPWPNRRQPPGAELLAEQAADRAEAARFYRLAGDKYLNDLQDYSNAARCYRLYLAARATTLCNFFPPIPGF